MKHRVKAKHFNRDTQSRKALLRNSLRGLIEHGHIETSEGRAKEIRRLADKLISQAQKDNLAARRRIHRYFGKRDVVNTLFDQVVPAVVGRKSGFCSLEKLSNRRGDNMPVYRLSLLIDEKNWHSLKNENKKANKKSTTKKEVKKTEKKSSKKTESTKETTKKKSK